MRRMVMILSVFLVLAGSLAVLVLPAWAQEPVFLLGAKPSEGRPGEELEVILFGGGFSNAREVRVTMGDIDVLEAWIEADDAILIHIFIPEDIPPGPRPIEVVAVFGPNEEFVAVLEEGFFVLEREPQPPPVVDGVEPQQVLRGDQVELNVFGRDFLPEAWVEIGGAGVLVHGVEFISPEHLLAFIEVTEEAPPDWREVIVINPDGQAGGRQRSLQIVGEGPPIGLLAGAAVLLLGLGGFIGRYLTLRSRLTWKWTAQLQWQLQASSRLPQAKKACNWACQAEATTDLLEGWKFTGLELTPYPQSSANVPAVKRVEDEESLDLLTEAAQPKYVLEDEEQTRQRIAPVVGAALEQILAWEAEGQTPASIKMDAHMNRDIKYEFKLYHCQQKGAKLDWVYRGVKWPGTLHQPGGEYLGVLRGPTADEPDFTARAREELEGCLVELVKSVRLKLV